MLLQQKVFKAIYNIHQLSTQLKIAEIPYQHKC